MSRPCPNCGTACAPEARFCRLCGTPLKPSGVGSTPVSPGAKTAPLTDEGRTTHGLSTEDGSASAPETARVRRAEMESILRRQAPTPAPQREAGKARDAFAADDETAIAAPVTSSLAGGAENNQRAGKDSKSVQTVEVRALRAERGARADGAAKEGRVAEPHAAPKRKDARRRRLQLAGLALVGLAVGAGALVFYYWRGSEANNRGPAATVSTNEQKRSVEEKLSEAETLLAEGKVAEAISRLRQAIRIEPSNARAHRLLAESLERTGAVNEAIDEYRAATQYDPDNEETLLRYADALRRVGRMDEAREIYQRLSSSPSAEVSRQAREQLDATASQTASNNGQGGDAASPDGAEEGTGDTASSSSSSSGRAASGSPASANGNNSGGASRPKNNPAASYTTAMKIIEGKDIRKMNRAELIRAYELFQYAQSGPNSADANRRLRELDKELFERRKRKQ